MPIGVYVIFPQLGVNQILLVILVAKKIFVDSAMIGKNAEIMWQKQEKIKLCGHNTVISQDENNYKIRPEAGKIGRNISQAPLFGVQT